MLSKSSMFINEHVMFKSVDSASEVMEKPSDAPLLCVLGNLVLRRSVSHSRTLSRGSYLPN
jgi:hypothetical protein